MASPLSELPEGSMPDGPHWFATTHWSVILSASAERNPGAEAALERLCCAYWFPIYAYVRRRGFNVPDAQDLTQEFFARLLDHHRLATISPEKGRFRSFLLASLNHFLSDTHDRTKRLKRGGDREIISIDTEEAEHRYALEPVENRTPESLFEQQWAIALLDRVLDCLRRELDATGKSELFAELEGCLVGEKAGAKQSQIATRLGVSESTVAVTVHRLRQRYRAILREELEQTVGSPAEVDEEMRHLFAVLRG